jgi:hypothetical protein
MSTTKYPETVHVLASALTLGGKVYERGDEVEVTPSLLELSKGRDGHSIFDAPSAALGFGPAPDALKAERAAAERAAKAQTLAWMRRNNPGIARALAAERRIAALEDELADGAA